MSSDGALLQMTSPMHSRVAVLGAHVTLRGSIAASQLPIGSVSGSLRKLTRTRGPLGRQIKKNAKNIVERLNELPVAGSDALQVASPLTAPSGMVTFIDVDPTVPSIQRAVMLKALVAPTAGWKILQTTVSTLPEEPIQRKAVFLEPVRATELPISFHRPDAPIGPVISVHPVTNPVISQNPVTLATLNNAWSSNIPAILSTTRRDLPAPLIFPSTEAGLASFHEEFQSAATEVVNYLGDAPLEGTAAQPLASFRTQLMSRIDPEITIKGRLGSRIPIGTGPDPLQPVRTGPQFPSAAMYEPLSDLSQEWMLPGISSIPVDKAVLVEPNARFIESYMLGLNEELSNELLWRQFPAALNSTFFQNFWTSSLAGGSTLTDIPEIKNFDPNKHLGEHVKELASAKTVVLLIRANLFRRYPNAIVSLVQAKWVDGTKGKARVVAGPPNYPNFRGQIGLDVTFFGFGLDELQVDTGPPLQVRPQTPAELQGSADPKDNKAGWYFVIEEHLAEPRFGLEPLETLDQPQVAGSTQPVWADLSWADLLPPKVSGATFLDPAVLPVKHPTLEDVTWGANAASMAYILMREPTRVALHAIALLEFPTAKAAQP